MALTLTMGHKISRKQILFVCFFFKCCYFALQFSSDQDENLHDFTASKSEKGHAILIWEMFMEIGPFSIA